MIRAIGELGRWLALPLGAALALAFAPMDQWWLALACPAALYWLWQGVSPREAAWRGLLFTAGTFLAGTYWLYHSIHIIGQAPVWVALFLMLGMVAIMGAYTALIGYVAARWIPARGALRWLVALPCLWVSTEWMRGWFLSGFPWLALGYSQLESPLRGFAPVLGVYGVSLVTAVSAGVLVTVIAGDRRERIAAVTVGVVTWAAGYGLVHATWTRAAGRPVSVALVQGAVPQSMKWEEGQRERTMRLYVGLTVPVLGTDVIVWPESAVPALAESIRPFLEQVAGATTARGSSLIMGLIRRDPASNAYYNSIASWSASDGTQHWYDKRRLVPFGEFFPVPATVREWLRLMNLPYSDFHSGSDTQPPLRAAGQALAPTVCYEDAYGSEQLRLARESTLLVNVTNDAWFGDSTAPHQHLDISRMRALESGRAMLRATNDGVTALIAYDGTVVRTLPQFQPAVLTGEVQPRTGVTPYLRFGNLPLLALLATGIGLGVAARRRRGDAVAQQARGASHHGVLMSEHRGDLTAEGEVVPSPKRALDYLEVEAPEPARAVALASDLLWARIPLPMELNHINVWLVDDGDGWLLVDTGLNEQVCREAWEVLGPGDLQGRPLRRILVTHDHPDHMGLSRWLHERHDAPLWMSEIGHRSTGDYLSSSGADVNARQFAFFTAHGLEISSDGQRGFGRTEHGRWYGGLAPLGRVVTGGDHIQTSQREWEVIETSGHCRGHLCLYDAAHDVLISGDQVLPTISPNVSVLASRPDANPLGDFLASLTLLERCPPTCLVLPSHGRPFRGLHRRIEVLRSHHHQQLDALRRECRNEPRAAYSLLPTMYGRPLRGFHRFLALAETVAHLNYLWHAGELDRRVEPDGRVLFGAA